jgi:hypothetical protein
MTGKGTIEVLSEFADQLCRRGERRMPMSLAQYVMNIGVRNMHGIGRHERDAQGSNPINHHVEWWMNGGNVSRLLRWLNDHDPLEFERIVEIVEKPWKWTDEYKQMLETW